MVSAASPWARTIWPRAVTRLEGNDVPFPTPPPPRAPLDKPPCAPESEVLTRASRLPVSGYTVLLAACRPGLMQSKGRAQSARMRCGMIS